MATGENDTVLSVFLQASNSGASVGFGAGVSCLPSTAIMLYHGHAGTGEPAGQITRPRPGIDPDIHTRSAQLGDTIVAGQFRYYQTAYRDRKAADAQNCNDPTKTFNVTQGVFVAWAP